MENDAVLYEVKDGIATLTIDREKSRNALSPDVMAGLYDGIAKAKEDDEARIVVITGVGRKAFCAGGDLSGSTLGAKQAGAMERRNKQGAIAGLFSEMAKLGKPIIGRVNGHALGGGIGLALACDMIVASEKATFGTPEIKVGLFPMMVMALLFRNVGRKRGMEMIFTGERLSAEEAMKLGMVNRVVPYEKLDEAVAELAGRIKNFSPAVLKLGRDAFYAMSDMELDKALEYLRNMLTINTLTEDAKEGVMAFIEKRDPNWKGE